MEKYQKLKDMDSKKWLSENCPHLDKTSQKIGLYELCLVMEEYHKYKVKIFLEGKECETIDKTYTDQDNAEDKYYIDGKPSYRLRSNIRQRLSELSIIIDELINYTLKE